MWNNNFDWYRFNISIQIYTNLHYCWDPPEGSGIYGMCATNANQWRHVFLQAASHEWKIEKGFRNTQNMANFKVEKFFKISGTHTVKSSTKWRREYRFSFICMKYGNFFELFCQNFLLSTKYEIERSDMIFFENDNS